MYFFVSFRFRLKIPTITYRDMLPLRASNRGWESQTESKGFFYLITVYSHKTQFQPQAIRAAKQTFSNFRAACRLPLLSFPLPLKRGSAILWHGLNKSDKYHTSGLWRVLLSNPLDCCQRTKLVRDSNTLQFRSKTQCPHPLKCGRF
jgi:hypothetical protein